MIIPLFCFCFNFFFFYTGTTVVYQKHVRVTKKETLKSSVVPLFFFRTKLVPVQRHTQSVGKKKGQKKIVFCVKRLRFFSKNFFFPFLV